MSHPRPLDPVKLPVKSSILIKLQGIPDLTAIIPVIAIHVPTKYPGRSN